MGAFYPRKSNILPNFQYGFSYQTELTNESEVFYLDKHQRVSVAGHPKSSGATWNVYATASPREAIEAGQANWIVWLYGENGNLSTAQEDTLEGNPIALKFVAVSGTTIFEVCA